jgi:hypothetical protein
MDEVICDRFYSRNGPAPLGRFSSGCKMKLVSTYNDKLSPERKYAHRQLLCCAEVRDTRDNWFYIIPPKILSRLRKWVDELRPNFPTLKMSIIKVKSNNVDAVSYSVSTIPMFTEVSPSNTGDFISIDIGMYPPYYGDQRCKIRSLKDTIERFLSYCVENGLRIYNNNTGNIVEKFLGEHFNSVRIELSGKVRPCQILYTTTGNYYSTAYANTVIDMADLTVDKLQNYLENVIKVNKVEFNNYIKEKAESKVGKHIYLLRVLYSKRRYDVERYLAHILIRAAFAEELHPFIDQYYLIKSKLPDVYFWNLIFLTQFGFDINPYYWLTSTRVFKFTTEEEFEKIAVGFQGTSASRFFDTNFVHRIIKKTEGSLSEIYRKGEFVNIYESMSGSTKVKPTDDFRSKSSTFMISDSYEVLLFDNSHYWVYNDEYNIKKCKKCNFVVV